MSYVNYFFEYYLQKISIWHGCEVKLGLILHFLIALDRRKAILEESLGLQRMSGAKVKDGILDSTSAETRKCFLLFCLRKTGPLFQNVLTWRRPVC